MIKLNSLIIYYWLVFHQTIDAIFNIGFYYKGRWNTLVYRVEHVPMHYLFDKRKQYKIKKIKTILCFKEMTINQYNIWVNNLNI